MSKYVVEGSATIGVPPDEDGHPFRLLKDGVKVFGGCWAECVEEGLYLAKDGEDTITTGTVEDYIDTPVEIERKRREEAVNRLGDGYGDFLDKTLAGKEVIVVQAPEPS
jgi:hypothetical protein